MLFQLTLNSSLMHKQSYKIAGKQKSIHNIPRKHGHQYRITMIDSYLLSIQKSALQNVFVNFSDISATIVVKIVLDTYKGINNGQVNQAVQIVVQEICFFIDIYIYMQNLTASPTQLKHNHPIGTQYPKTDFCFTIQGNIGCGKSTFLQILRKEVSEAHWIQQPVRQWQNLSQNNINMLEKYYKEPKRWGFTFQVYAIFTRIQKMQEAIQRYPQKIKISQRSILADKYVFSQLMRDLGYMDQSEYQIFKSLYPTFQSMANIEKTKVIYLRCKPQKCYERTKMRMRAEESEIPLEYLQLIHDKHELWFKNFEAQRVLVIETTEDFKNNPEKIHEMLRKLKEFMQN